MSYSLAFPEIIRFGVGERFKLVDLLPQGSVLFISGKHSGARIQQEIIPRLGGRAYELISDIHPEPPLSDVERSLTVGRRMGATAIVGWGGGSAMDVAKCVASLMPLTGSVADYFYGRRELAGSGAFLAEVPTTAGTGAEITSNAVLGDPQTGIKQSIRGKGMGANLAIIDPELTYDCPNSVTAASGFDALTQAIESFISRRANSVSRALAVRAAKNIFSNLSSAWRGDTEARSWVAEGSMMGAMAFSGSGLGAVHGIGHPLGSILQVPHGVCCAILLPTVMRWNLEVASASLTELSGVLIGKNDPTGLIERIEELRNSLELPVDFKSWGLGVKHQAFVVANCRSGSMKCNPRELSDTEVCQILEELS